MKGTRAMMCIAFIAYTISAIAYCVWIGKGKKYLREHGIGTIGMVALISALIGGRLNILCVHETSVRYAAYQGHYAAVLFWGVPTQPVNGTRSMLA